MKTPLDQLQKLFKPTSIALFGASDAPDSLGTVILRNLRTAGYQGDLVLINPKYQEIDGCRVFNRLGDAKRTVDTAIIVTPAATVPDIIVDCGEQGVPSAIVISAGFRETGSRGLALERQLLERARRHKVRILGPNCLGIIRTDIGLNATFSANHALSGRIAVISQSGALCAAILDWAQTNDVGFSSLISTGNGVDTDFGEILDFLSLDPETDSIMIYVEGVRDARRFMSALRSAARTKPVVVMKGGRHTQGSHATTSHTGTLVGSDHVFDAAIRRAGALRVADFADFFSTATTLASGVRTSGKRLAIVTNAGGPGVMAADHAADKSIALARLSADTIEQLDAILPTSWSRGNPVDLLGDATPERYQSALKMCLADRDVDAALVILTPQAVSAPLDVAERLISPVNGTRKPVLACWMGGGSMVSSWELFHKHHIPSYRTPEAAVSAFAALAAYHDNQRQLLQVPDPLARQLIPDHDNAKLIIDNVLAEGRRILTLTESKAVLAAFRIPIVQSFPASTSQEAMLVAQEIGYPVAMKIDSPDITHKTDVGGVSLDLANARQIHSGFHKLTASVVALRPDAHIDGVVIEPMWQDRDARELMVGMVKDEVFGPVISCGLGGTMVEVIGDTAVALPPLNRFLAGDLIDRTRASLILDELRGAPAASRRAIEDLLLQVSEMVCELPTVVEMDLNPVMASKNGVVVVDARIAVAPYNASLRPYEHMAIHPYPRNLVQEIELAGGTLVTIRPIRPEDALIEREFVNGLSQQSRYFRFMYSLKKISPDMLSRFTQIDYDREIALIAVIEVAGGERQIGVTRYATLPDLETCEFAIVVADEWQDKGLARQLLSALIQAARFRQYKRMVGDVLAKNQRMLGFTQSLGFKVRPAADDPELVEVELEL